MMLDFYGIQLVNNKTGQLERFINLKKHLKIKKKKGLLIMKKDTKLLTISIIS